MSRCCSEFYVTKTAFNRQPFTSGLPENISGLIVVLRRFKSDTIFSRELVGKRAEVPGPTAHASNA